MNTVCFWIALDNPKISIAETLTLLNSYNVPIKEISVIGRALLLKINTGDWRLIDKIVRRSANVKKAYLILKELKEFNFRDVSSEVRDAVLNQVDTNSESIAISLVSDQSIYIDEDLGFLTKKIADSALRGIKTKIDLEHPDKRIVVLLPRDKVFIGLEIVGTHSKGFVNRIPRKRPAKSPHALHPKLARAMVNLSGALENELILDPFCGIGSILIEANLLGIESIGIDIMYKWVSGAKINLNWIGSTIGHLICGDSLEKPVRRADYIVTDPPYGRTTTLGGYSESKEVINKFLDAASQIEDIKRIVFMSPKALHIDVEKYGFKEKYKFEIPVHRKLVRVLRVIDYNM